MDSKNMDNKDDVVTSDASSSSSLATKMPLEQAGHARAIDFKSKNIVDILQQQGQPERRHSMRGFEPVHADIVDYIVRITHRIWEEGDIGHIYDTYGHNCPVHSPYGVSYGAEETVAASVSTLAAFPDRRIYADDVIWTGDDVSGFHTSHLITSKATNFGYSPWGPPTHKQVEYRVAANCVVKRNKIVEEWVIRDTAAILRQLGFDAHEVAQSIAQGLAQKHGSALPGETARLQGQTPPKPYELTYDLSEYTSSDNNLAEGTRAVEKWLTRALHNMWNVRQFHTIAATHSADALMHVPNYSTLFGIGHIRTYMLHLISMLPDLTFNVEHVYSSVHPDDMIYRVAVRWRILGTHRGPGWYGQPSGKRVNILGISHIHVELDERGKPWITKHFCIYDELAVLAQLYV
jgi:predicted ester cyclase